MIVVDTSVVFKWLVVESDSFQAERLIGQALVAPDFVLLECGNALWKRVRASETTADAAVEALATLSTFVTVVETLPLAARALEIATLLPHAIYDCTFLALAERERLPLVTADARFRNKVIAARLPIAVTLLADWQPA